MAETLTVIDQEKTASAEHLMGFYPPPDWHFELIPTDVINYSEQQRQGKNERQSELTESLKDGMINAVNVAILHKDLLSEYLEFVNHTWSANRSLEEFKPHPGDNNFYVFLFAGHSRLLGHIANAEKAGLIPELSPIVCRVHNEINTIADIVRLQLKENIHSSPPPDRSARVIAEAYIWLKEKYPQLSKAQFARMNSLKSGALNDALAYVALPPEIRYLTDDGQLPFTIGLELGRAYPHLLEEARINHEIDGLPLEECQAYVKEAMQAHIVYYNEKKNVTTTRARIKSEATSLKDRHEQRLLNPDMDMQLFDAREFFDPRAILRKTIESGLRDFQSERSMAAARLHASSIRLLGWGQEFSLEGNGQEAAVDLGLIALSS